MRKPAEPDRQIRTAPRKVLLANEHEPRQRSQPCQRPPSKRRKRQPQEQPACQRKSQRTRAPPRRSWRFGRDRFRCRSALLHPCKIAEFVEVGLCEPVCLRPLSGHRTVPLSAVAESVNSSQNHTTQGKNYGGD